MNGGNAVSTLEGGEDGTAHSNQLKKHELDLSWFHYSILQILSPLFIKLQHLIKHLGLAKVDFQSIIFYAIYVIKKHYLAFHMAKFMDKIQMDKLFYLKK